jgi:hypothetical protein
MPKHIVGAVCCCAAFALCADEPPVANDAPQKHKTDWLEKYYPHEQRIYGWVENTARSLDSFFGTDDAWSTDNESWLRVTNDIRWDQTDQGAVDFRPRLKLDLPTASKRLHLLIENDTPEQRTAAQEAVPSLRNVNNERTTVFGLGTGLDTWAPAWKKSLQGGVRVALPIDPYVRFIAKRDWDLAGTWQLSSYNRLAWFNHDGYSAKSELKIGQPLVPRWRFDFITDLSWREDRDYLEFAESVNFSHVLSERSAINYALGAAGTGFQGPQITSYFFVADYRRNIARRIIFIDLIPELTYPREFGFNPRFGFTFRLELYFQKQIAD